MPSDARVVLMDEFKERKKKRGTTETTESLKRLAPKRDTHKIKEKTKLRELIIRYQKGEEKAAEEITKINKPVVDLVIRKCRIPRKYGEVAENAAYLALLEFSNKCNPGEIKKESIERVVTEAVQEAQEREKYGGNIEKYYKRVPIDGVFYTMTELS